MTSAKPSCSSVSVSDRPYIVGIGASAGGVEALCSLLSRFTLDNTAFVVVLHISPYYDSKLAEILGRYAAMPVVRVEGLTVLAGNRIYVIRPGWDLMVAEGVLKLVAQSPSQPRRSINILFESIAEDQRRFSIGVVLSGTGSDGAAGLKAIKAQGGTTFVQEPKTAQFSDMPRNALPHADFILSPEPLGDEIMSFVKSLPGR